MDINFKLFQLTKWITQLDKDILSGKNRELWKDNIKEIKDKSISLQNDLKNEIDLNEYNELYKKIENLEKLINTEELRGSHSSY